MKIYHVQKYKEELRNRKMQESMVKLEQRNREIKSKVSLKTRAYFVHFIILFLTSMFINKLHTVKRGKTEANKLATRRKLHWSRGQRQLRRDDV
jgi:hypothetical protein